MPDNSLIREIPSELGELLGLTVPDPAENQLSGEIYCELGNLTNLEWVHLTGNALMRCVPRLCWTRMVTPNRLDLPACN